MFHFYFKVKIMKGWKTFIVLIAISVILLGISIFRSIQLNQNCIGYLKQAADANTVELAEERLEKAILYAEESNLTYGYTSVFYKTEDENVGFWYQNLKACREELKSCKGKSQLEKSNILMKVRESLTDNGQSGTDITYPDGLAYYPNNIGYGILRGVGWFLLFLAICWPKN